MASARPIEPIFPGVGEAPGLGLLSLTVALRLGFAGQADAPLLGLARLSLAPLRLPRVPPVRAAPQPLAPRVRAAAPPPARPGPGGDLAESEGLEVVQLGEPLSAGAQSTRPRTRPPARA